MNVLITIQSVGYPAGAQVFVRDLAIALQERGHRAAVFSRAAADAPRWRGFDGVTVCRDAAAIPFGPDVIHALQHFDGMIAMTAFPRVPAIRHVHGAHWKWGRLSHPRIGRYLVMSETLAVRLASEYGVDPSIIEVFLNTVDLRRFAKAKELPERPERALVFNPLHSRDTPTGAAIAAAASAAGLDLDFFGLATGQTADRPEALLAGYDIAFASGKSAIDALACGCAVIIVGRTSCGELVDPENLDRFRRVNFSIPVNAPPPSASRIEDEIARYSADGCRRVTDRLRREADQAPAIDRLEAIYGEVIRRHASHADDAEAERNATVSYLRGLTRVVALVEQLRSETPQSAALSGHASAQIAALASPVAGRTGDLAACVPRGSDSR